jgi:IclR family acetate operon transcriptional repressor
MFNRLNATNSLERALDLLERIEQTPGGLTNAQISRDLQIPKSSCSWILARLERKGYLARDPAGRYRIGLTTVALAHGALRDLGLRSIAEPALYQLASQTGLSASIGVLERGRVLLVDRVESRAFMDDLVRAAASGGRRMRNAIRLREQRDIGRELPAHANALGKVLLAWLDREQVLKIIDEQGLRRATPKTITSAARLFHELERVRELGFATSYEEQYPGICAVGAPLLDQNGEVNAAISVTGSPSAANWREPTELVARLKAAALSFKASKGPGSRP